MANIHWNHAVSGNFGTASDWSGGLVPGVGDDAVLGAFGASQYTVTVSANEAVSSIQTASTAYLSITGGTFVAANGTGPGRNAGSILVGRGAGLSIAGTTNNTGLISMDGANGGLAILTVNGEATWNGGGQVRLNSSGQNAIIAGGTGATLTNVDNTISGAGFFGNNASFILKNRAHGVISATFSSYGLFFYVTVINAGLIEAAGAIYISRTVDGSSGGTIANLGGGVHLQGADIIGGILKGPMAVDGAGTVLDGRKSAVTIEGALAVAAGQSLTLEGTFDNLASVSGGPLTIGGGKVILGGSGSIAVSGIVGASGGPATTLINVNNTITGGGQIGDGQLVLNNRGHGVIEATSGEALILSTPGHTIINDGLVEAAGTGTVVVRGAIDNTGALEANGGSLAVNAVVTGAGRGLVNCRADR